MRHIRPPVNPQGDGLTQETAYHFPNAKSYPEMIDMAHRFMKWRGRKYTMKKQFQHIDSSDSEIIEWWETAAGKFWFRYRMETDGTDE